MESGFHYVSQAPSVFRVVLGAISGIIGGMLAAASTIVAIGLLILIVSPPVLSSVAIGMLGIGFGFLIGGAIARHLAGQRPARGWMGVLFALAFVGALYLLPQRGWAWMPQHGWVSATSLEDLVAQGDAKLVHGYTLPIQAITLVAGAVLGWLGDVSVTRRRRPRAA